MSGGVYLRGPMQNPSRWAVGVEAFDRGGGLVIVEEVPAPPLINAPDFDRQGREIPPPPGGPPSYHIRHAERLQSDSTYPKIADRVAELVARKPLKPETCKVVIDITNLGTSVLALFAPKLHYPVGITLAGSAETEQRTAYGHRVPRLSVTSAMVALFHSERLKIAATLAEAAALREELEHFNQDAAVDDAIAFATRRGDLAWALAIVIWWLARAGPAPLVHGRLGV